MAALLAIPHLLHSLPASPLHGPPPCPACSRLRRAVSWPRSFGGVAEPLESSLGNSVQGSRRNFRSRCVSAKPANSQHELHSAEELREQLEALQLEAEQVRGKRCMRAANSARLRFMRLSHVVEQLRHRAAMDVRTGKEDSARLLLTEKQKVMKALEAARQRAELFEQLAGKLNVAISMKETVLIEVLSSAPLSRSETTDHTSVRHVSPRTEGVSEETIHGRVDDDGDIGSRDGLNLDRDRNIKGSEDHDLE